MMAGEGMVRIAQMDDFVGHFCLERCAVHPTTFGEYTFPESG